MVNFIIDNWAAIATVLFGISEGLAAIPAVKANSMFQMLFGLIKKLAGKE